jgi:hypothetical protein
MTDKLPDIPDFFRPVSSDMTEARQPATPANTDVCPTPDDDSLPAKLERLTGKAIDEADRILALPLDENSAQFGTIARTKATVIGHALSTQVKVDENNLRRRVADHMPEILRRIAEQEQKLAQRNAAGGER